MQVGPVANVLVGYAQGHGRPLGVEEIHSTMGRYVSRAIPCAMLAELAVKYG